MCNVLDWDVLDRMACHRKGSSELRANIAGESKCFIFNRSRVRFVPTQNSRSSLKIGIGWETIPIGPPIEAFSFSVPHQPWCKVIPFLGGPLLQLKMEQTGKLYKYLPGVSMILKKWVNDLMTPFSPGHWSWVDPRWTYKVCTSWVAKPGKPKGQKLDSLW